jgi:hypothetical protein
MRSSRTSCGLSTPSTYSVRLVRVSSSALRAEGGGQHRAERDGPEIRITALASRKTRSNVTERWTAQPRRTPVAAGEDMRPQGRYRPAPGFP